jgi:alkylation response protein AidB-like acyl-CoA dehydrogenase
MDFSLTEEQEMLKNLAGDFLKNECPMTLVREMAEDETGYSPQLWQRMAALGWQGLVFPNEYGGTDGGFLDLVVLLEEMGYALTLDPFFTSVVLGGLTLLGAGSEEQKSAWLPSLIKGDLLLSLAIIEPGTGYEGDPSAITARAASHQGDFVIQGSKLLVPYAHAADYIICVARSKDKTKADEGITLFMVDAKSAGLTCIPLNTIGQNHQSEVRFDDVRVPRQNILGEPDKGWPHMENVLQKATAALCAYMNGATRRILEMMAGYARDRIQFGRPIGSFQAIQHHCADTAAELEASKDLTREAAWKIDRGEACRTEVSMAKAWASESCRQASWYGMQIHGGIGHTADHEMSLCYRQAKMAESTLGDIDLHQEIIAAGLLD